MCTCNPGLFPVSMYLRAVASLQKEIPHKEAGTASEGHVHWQKREHSLPVHVSSKELRSPMFSQPWLLRGAACPRMLGFGTSIFAGPSQPRFYPLSWYIPWRLDPFLPSQHIPTLNLLQGALHVVLCCHEKPLG